MSEPMSTIDIEDVLSSIRKLVSDDLRPAAPQEEPVSAPAPKDAAGDGKGKLLLTSALRVVSANADAPQADDIAPKAFVEGGNFVFSSRQPQQSPAAAAPVLADTPPIAKPAQTPDEDWLPESNDEAEPYPGWAPTEMPTASNVTRVVGEIAAGVSEVDEEWESETGDAPDVSWQAPDWAERPAARTKDKPLPESAAKAISDKAEAAVVAEMLAATVGPASSAVANVATVATSHDDLPELRFDEAVLRDLVRDLIHEELGGSLGERITRNVRKLVRSEINRALTSRTLE
jgi:hypothetical protein